MVDIQRTRFQDAPWFKTIDNHYITIGGAGGIGSWTALLVSRIGFPNIEIFDFDTIEQHNMGGQWFKKSDIGKPKVQALKDNIYDFSQISVTAINNPIDSTTAVGDIVISAFDNMKARKDLFTAWKNQNKGNPNAIFIDGRLSAEYLEIYCIKNTEEDISFYESEDILFEDSAIEDTICSMKQTSHFATMIASLMTTYLSNHVANIAAGEVERSVPRETKFTGPLNLFNTD